MCLIILGWKPYVWCRTVDAEGYTVFMLAEEGAVPPVRTAAWGVCQCASSGAEAGSVHRSCQAALLLSCPWKKLIPQQVFPVFAPGLPVGPSTGPWVSLCTAPQGDSPALSAALCVCTDKCSGRGEGGAVCDVLIKPVSSQMLWNGVWPLHTSRPLLWMSGGMSDCFCSFPSPAGQCVFTHDPQALAFLVHLLWIKPFPAWWR